MQREHSGSALVLGVFILLGLAALGFISTIALAKYVADEQMF